MAKKKKASLADGVKNKRLQGHIRMHEGIINNPGKTYGSGESGWVKGKYEPGLTGDKLIEHQKFLRRVVTNSENELKRLTDPKTEESYNLEDKEVKERKAKERKENPVAKKKDKPAEKKAESKPASAPAAAEKKPRGRPKKTTPAVEAAVSKATESMAKKDKPAKKETPKAETKPVEAPAQEVSTPDTTVKQGDKGQSVEPRNFGAKKEKSTIWDAAKAAGGGMSFGELSGDEKTGGGTGKPKNFGAKQKGDGGYWAEERKASAERARRGFAAENFDKVSEDNYTPGVGLTSEPSTPVKNPTVTSVDPSAPKSAEEAPKKPGRLRGTLARVGKWFGGSEVEARKRGEAASAGAPPSTPPTPAAGGGATPPTPPAGGGAMPPTPPAGGGRSGAFQSGHSAFNNVGAIQGNTFQGDISGGVTAGSPFSTNNQTLNYGGGVGGGMPSTITNSGRATGGGKGGAVSNSGVASSHPRAKNAARGGRRTTKSDG